MIKLGPRLRAVAGFVLPGLAVADVCCDHARLVAHLVERGVVPRAIAIDQAVGPLAGAARLLAERGLDGRIVLRRGDGLSVLEPGEVETVVIAGVGAPLAGRLLEAGAGRLAGVRRLIVQANHGFPQLGSLRAVIDKMGWTLTEEAIVRDTGRLYVILVAEPGERRLADAVERELGPVLSQGRDPLWTAWLAHERERIANTCAALEQAGNAPDKLARHRSYLDLLLAHET